MLTIVAGDFHGVWGKVNSLINKKRPDVLLQCGDFGWFPEFHNTKLLDTGQGSRNKRWNQYGLKPKDTKIYWCDGNHDDHWSLEGLLQFETSPVEVLPNVYYMRRGSTLTLDNGATVMFVGGAMSTDKASRRLGIDWWPQETISESDLLNLPDKEVDIIISHTCPSEFINSVTDYRRSDPSVMALSYVLHKYRPKLWYFGHFHHSAKGQYLDTKWRSLNMVPDTGWWTVLDGLEKLNERS